MSAYSLNFGGHESRDVLKIAMDYILDSTICNLWCLFITIVYNNFHVITKIHVISVMSQLQSPVWGILITFIEESVQPINTPASPSRGYSEDGLNVATGI